MIKLDFSNEPAHTRTPYWTLPPAPAHLYSLNIAGIHSLCIVCGGFFTASIAFISELIGLSRSSQGKGLEGACALVQTKHVYPGKEGWWEVNVNIRRAGREQTVDVGNQAVPWPLHPSAHSQYDTQVMDSFVAGWHISSCLLTHVSPFLSNSGGRKGSREGEGDEREK